MKLSLISYVHVFSIGIFVESWLLWHTWIEYRNFIIESSLRAPLITSLTSSHTLAKIYNLGELSDNLLRNRIVLGLLDHATRKKLLAEHKLTLGKCINICRANETTTKQFWKNNKWWNKCCYTSRRPQRSDSGSSRWSNVPRNKGFGSGQRNSDPPQIKCEFCLKIHVRKNYVQPGRKTVKIVVL